MDYELRNAPAYTVADVRLDPGEEITAEAGALLAHTDSITMTTGIGDTNEGLLESVKDSVLGDESLFRNRFRAESAPGTVTLAPPIPGDMAVLDLHGDDVYLQSGAYVAGAEGVALDTDVGGMSSLFGGEGLFLLRASGNGPLLVSAFGGITEYEIAAGETYTVESGHVVAWDTDMDYRTESIGGLKESLFSDEGRVMRFDGPGTVHLQSRSYEAFVTDIAARLPSGGGDGGEGGNGFDVGGGGFDVQLDD